MALNHGGVDDEVAAAQRFGAVGGLLETELRPDLVGVAPRHAGDRVEALGVDVHEVDLAPFQVGRQAQIPDEAEGEGGGTGADYADAYGTWHVIPPAIEFGDAAGAGPGEILVPLLSATSGWIGSGSPSSVVFPVNAADGRGHGSFVRMGRGAGCRRGGGQTHELRFPATAVALVESARFRAVCCM